MILTSKQIYFFSLRGDLISQEKNNKKYNIIDSTIDSDFFIGSTHHNTIKKYSFSGEFLFELKLTSLKSTPVTFSIYKPYGDLVAFNFDEGAYFSMKTTIKINYCKQKLMPNTVSVICDLKSTFPTSISAVLNKQELTKYPLETKEINAGTHQIIWKNIPNTYKNSSIQLTSKGLYSNQEIIKNSINLNDKL